MFYILFCCYILLSTCGLLLIKQGGNETAFSLGAQTLTMHIEYKFVVGLVCYILSFFLFTFILQKRDLSLIYPLSAGIVNVISVILGVVVLKETISITGVIGIILVISGVVVLCIGR